MVTIIFLAIFGVLILGFVIWTMAFGSKRRESVGQGAELETPKQGRAPGAD